MCSHVRRLTGMRHLALAGGVALNCVANGKILRSGLFDDLWIQPAAGDAGGALGAALLVSHAYFGLSRTVAATRRDQQKGSYLGPAFKSNEIRAFLDRHAYPYHRMEDPKQRHRTIAQALADGKIVGYFSGRMEFGPRALGARSILGDARKAETQSAMNLKIKFRESFRPFAPSVMVEMVHDYFQMNGPSPYMLLVAPVQPDRCLPFDLQRLRTTSDDMLPIVNVARSDIPAVTHVDYSARVQTVDAEDNAGLSRPALGLS